MNDSTEYADLPDECPCGSGLGYSDCCGPLHRGFDRAATAEQLMRSRFSAYALGDESYLLQTWDKTTRPASIDLSRQDIEWTRLQIIGRRKGTAADRNGMVEFKAFYRSQGREQLLHEISRFHKIGDLWQYRDGQLNPGSTIDEPANPGRNAPCPCGSGKKAKRCCGRV